ncbi:hypothetical protein IKG28_03110 [Candidatus Saccharibacteria bacterium]|nr:hypothetical protein [Candidatus Saccharibacteria bacterium]MBR3332588.1 hypothetical protein [Candidatus Saccharibacteria bacterium]
MQLIIILLVVVSILTFLSGAIVFFGSTKGNRARSAWYFAAAIFATIWMASISAFLMAEPSWGDSVDWHIKWTFSSALFLDAAFLGYTAWKAKYGKPLTILFLILAASVSCTIFMKPELLYTGFSLSPSGNSVSLNIGPMYIIYASFFGAIVPAIIVNLFLQYVKTTSIKKRKVDIVTMISFGISSIPTLIFNLIMPLMGHWNMVWMGPLALSITIIAVYYTILRYRSLNLNSIWLKFFSYIVITASLAILYMLIFSIIFAGMFRGATPSTEVIVLNFVMIFIVIILMPAISNLTMYIRSLVSGEPEQAKAQNTDDKKVEK